MDVHGLLQLPDAAGASRRLQQTRGETLARLGIGSVGGNREMLVPLAKHLEDRHLSPMQTTPPDEDRQMEMKRRLRDDGSSPLLLQRKEGNGLSAFMRDLTAAAADATESSFGTTTAATATTNGNDEEQQPAATPRAVPPVTAAAAVQSTESRRREMLQRGKGESVYSIFLGPE